MENIPGSSVVTPDTQPPPEDDASTLDDINDDEDEDEHENGEVVASQPVIVDEPIPRGASRSQRPKPQTPERPSIETRQQGQRQRVADYLEAPIRSVITLNLLPSTLAVMERCLSDPDEFDFMEERTPSGFFDAVTEIALMTLDPDYSYRLTLVKEPRATIAEAS